MGMGQGLREPLFLKNLIWECQVMECRWGELRTINCQTIFGIPGDDMTSS